MFKDLLIKGYFYTESGTLVVSDFRNVGLGIFALYFALKLSNPLLLVAMGLVSIPILIVVGYINVHIISPVRERLNIKFGTHYGIKQFELVESQVRLLTEIKEIMNKKKVTKVMGEWKKGTLHSGSKTGPKVKSQKQAVAIALSEAKKMKK